MDERNTDSGVRQELLPLCFSASLRMFCKEQDGEIKQLGLRENDRTELHKQAIP